MELLLLLQLVHQELELDILCGYRRCQQPQRAQRDRTAVQLQLAA
jgi:hypothetical protein